MSLSNPTTKNPCSKFLRFKHNEFEYYDKETKENVVMKRPFKFIVLDELSTISGFNEEMKCGIYSNEVHNLNKQKLDVRVFKGNYRLIGLYGEIKNDIKAIGGRFTKSVYCALIGKELELINLQLTGSSFSAWMEMRFDQTTTGIKVSKELAEGKKGSNTYSIPIYETFKIDEKDLEKAIEMDKTLQKYLETYADVKEVGDDVEDDIKDDDTEKKSPEEEYKKD